MRLWLHDHFVERQASNVPFFQENLQRLYDSHEQYSVQNIISKHATSADIFRTLLDIFDII